MKHDVNEEQQSQSQKKIKLINQQFQEQENPVNLRQIPETGSFLKNLKPLKINKINLKNDLKRIKKPQSREPTNQNQIPPSGFQYDKEDLIRTSERNRRRNPQLTESGKKNPKTEFRNFLVKRIDLREFQSGRKEEKQTLIYEIERENSQHLLFGG